jgi:hypothetical protein
LKRNLERHLVLDHARAQAWYGQDFAASPTAAVLRALADELASAGVLTVFVMAPLNVERLAALGLPPAAVRERIERLREAVSVPSADWIYTTDLFRARDFRDALHVTPEAIERMAAAVGDVLASRLDGAR